MDPADFDDCKHGLMRVTCSLCNPKSKSAVGSGATKTTGVTSSKPMHLLLKWNPDHESTTREDHRQTAERMGTSWWGCYTAGTRNVRQDRIQTLNRQLSRRIDTWAFIYKTGPVRDIWRTRVTALSEDGSSVDPTHRPPNYDDEGLFLYVEVSEFVELQANFVTTRLGRWDDSMSGPLTLKSVNGRTTPMYVYEITPET